MLPKSNKINEEVPASPCSTISCEQSPVKKGDDTQQPGLGEEAERVLAIKMKLLSEMSERIEQRPPRITRTTIMPDFDQIPDESGELRYKGDQWAAKATYLLTNLFLYEAALEACAIESCFELARAPGLEELEEMFSKVTAYNLPARAEKAGAQSDEAGPAPKAAKATEAAATPSGNEHTKE